MSRAIARSSHVPRPTARLGAITITSRDGVMGPLWPRAIARSSHAPHPTARLGAIAITSRDGVMGPLWPGS